MITGQVVWEASASLAIGVLLGYVAYRLGREARDQLIGEAADPRASERIRELLRAQPEIDSVEALFTMKTGLDTALVGRPRRPGAGTGQRAGGGGRRAHQAVHRPGGPRGGPGVPRRHRARRDGGMGGPRRDGERGGA